jgi:uncharacterized protein
MNNNLTRLSNHQRRIPKRLIRHVAKRIADKFNPDKIVLFGSYAYGKPTANSDVDLLIVMNTPLRERQQRLEISRAISPRPFPIDIVVRTPAQVKERIRMGDYFITEIMAQGQILYERPR